MLYQFYLQEVLLSFQINLFYFCILCNIFYILWFLRYNLSKYVEDYRDVTILKMAAFDNSSEYVNIKENKSGTKISVNGDYQVKTITLNGLLQFIPPNDKWQVPAGSGGGWQLGPMWLTGGGFETAARHNIEGRCGRR